MSHGRALLVSLVAAALGAMLGRGGLMDQPIALSVCAGACALLFVAMALEVLKGGHGPILRAQLDRIEAKVTESESAKLAALADVEAAVLAEKAAVNQLVRMMREGAAPRSAGGTGSGPPMRDP